MRQVIRESLASHDAGQVLERPAGFYWQSKDGRREFGPFATLGEATNDMQLIDDEDVLEIGESLEEAEAEVGIGNWIDPETGEPAQKDAPRIEEH